MSIQFSLFLPQMRMPFGTVVDKAQAAEEAGFDGIGLMDHLVPPGVEASANHEAFVMATAIACATERLRICHLVLCNQFRHPAVLAKQVASLDHASDGRFDLGIGWGSWPKELPMFDVGDEPARTRAQRLRESLEVLRLLETGEQVDYSGDFYQLREAVQQPVPVQGHVPVIIGGTGPKLTMPLVREFADWWNCPSYGADDFEEHRALAGDTRSSLQRPIGLAASTADRQEVVELAERRFGYWGGLRAGTPDEITEALIQDVHAGAEWFFLMFTDFADPDTLQTFGREVIPAVRAAA